ncbi:hypothetical protein HY251_08780 [bacterium]|nr:hypothetical protein [bacterium]
MRVGAIFSPGPFLEEAALPIPTAKPSLALASQGAALRANGPGDENLTYDELRSALEARERRYIAAVLKETASKSIAAKKLGMTRYALYRIMKRLAIPDSIEPEQMSESDEAALVAHSSGSGGSPESV